MSVARRLHYYRRIFAAYLTPGESQLTFWHDTPGLNENAFGEKLGQYYMEFFQKANFAGLSDASGIPMLDYRGRIGPQYNPIAIAQWGLGNHDLFKRQGDAEKRRKSLAASDWLCSHLEENRFGVWVWNHYFDWEYRSLLKSPWYSGLAQGQAISLLLRSHRESGERRYLEAAERAFNSFLKPTDQGGVAFIDSQNNLWFEEYIVSPPTHILNGFIWAAWGVYDYSLATGSTLAGQLFTQAVDTLIKNLSRYDIGFWSLYELSATALPMVASRFYHRLHIVQLEVMHRLTGEKVFADFAERWREYSSRGLNRYRALAYKSAFKLCYY